MSFTPPSFDFNSFEDFRRRHPSMMWRIWSRENMDHMRLPANIGIYEFLLYCGQRFQQWLVEIGYSGENIMFSPAYPDIIYSNDRAGIEPVSQDSPYVRIPKIIAHKIRYRAPASTDQPFGKRKNWKFRTCGEFRADDGTVHVIRSRQWENLVQFTLVARSGNEAEWLCLLLEEYMELNEYYFLAAGLQKIVPYSVIDEPDVMLDSAKLHYRKMLYWMRTEEFRVSGPVSVITEVETDVYPTQSMDEISQRLFGPTIRR